MEVKIRLTGLDNATDLLVSNNQNPGHVELSIRTSSRNDTTLTALVSIEELKVALRKLSAK